MSISDLIIFFVDYRVAVPLALLLLALLALREVARVSSGPLWQALARALLVSILPLLIIVIATVTIRLAGAFGL